jgi:hypothetical protein
MTRSTAIAAVLAGAALDVACHRAPRETPATAPADAAPSASAAPAPPHVTAPALPCRVVTLEGDVRPVHGDQFDGGTVGAPLMLQATVPDDTWLLAGARARLVAKDPRTTRETTFLGAARFRACVGRREESWLGSGRFESSVGAGESPGAEEWVITPFAVVRYAAAKLQLEGSERAMTLSIEGGQAFVWAADDAHAERRDRTKDAGAEDVSDRPWMRVSDGTMQVFSVSATAARSAVDACAERARGAEALTRDVMAGADAAPGEARERVTGQVRARRLARATCALAGLRVELARDTEARGALEDALRDANARWAAVPLAQP